MEPCTIPGSTVDFRNSNSHLGLPSSGNTTNHELSHLPDHHCSNVFYGNQYGSLQHNHSATSVDLRGVAPSNPSYNPYMVPSSSSRIGPMPWNHDSSDYSPSSSNHRVFGIDEHGRNHHFMDNIRGSCKRKNAEGIPDNYYCINGQASSSASSSGVHLNSELQQWEEPYEPRPNMLDAAPFAPSEYRGSLLISEGLQRSVRSRSSAINLQMDSAFVNHHSQLPQGSYMGRSFHPPSNARLEQFGNNSGDRGSTNWNYRPSMPDLHGRGINGSNPEIGSMYGQRYQDTTSSRSSEIVFHPSSSHQHHQQMQGMHGGHNHSYHPQIPAPLYRHPVNTSHHAPLNLSRDGLESNYSRYSRSFSSSGDRTYRPQRRAPQTASDDINRRMRILSSDDVAILEFSGFYGVDNFIDQHRDMRLDIDDMSYEELLALEERIGDVSTGLSEETILKCLKTTHNTCTASSPLNHSTDVVMQENGTCIICQVEYEENEKIGILDCGHDYHADCIKQWLLVKNICPICKASALSVYKKDE